VLILSIIIPWNGNQGQHETSKTDYFPESGNLYVVYLYIMTPPGHGTYGGTIFPCNHNDSKLYKQSLLENRGIALSLIRIKDSFAREDTDERYCNGKQF
jgi:hypothetical protein